MEYHKKHPSFKLDYFEGPTKKTVEQVSMVFAMRTGPGERATAVDRSLVTSFGTTEHTDRMENWKSKLQMSVALSTAEAEYYLASLGAVEVIYLRQLLRE